MHVRINSRAQGDALLPLLLMLMGYAALRVRMNKTVKS